jgi:hypothetical protein
VRVPDPPGGAHTCTEVLAALVERFAAQEQEQTT